MAHAKPTLTTDPGPRYTQCKEDAVKLLDRATIEWSRGDPSNPSVEEVLKSVLELFIKERFLKPPNGAR